MARSVAISRARAPTAAYIVLRAANIAPSAMMKVTTPASAPIVLRNCSVWPLKYSCSVSTSTLTRGSADSASLTVCRSPAAGELQPHRAVALAVEGGLRDVDVRPQLALVGVARGEHADHRPVRAAHAQRLAEADALELSRDALADDQLAQALGERASLDDPQLRPQRERGRFDAAHRDVGAGRSPRPSSARRSR